MKSTHAKLVFLVAGSGLLFAGSAFAEDEDAADLQSYSVGDRRGNVEQEKVVIERPKFENNFKFEAPKPSLSGLKLTKPKLQVMTGPEPSTTDGSVPTRTAQANTSPQAAGAAPSAGATAPPTGETRAVRPLNMDPPSYPRDALRRREEGFVVIEFTINTDGRTEDINVVDADPRGTFESEARRAVARWTFEPAMRDGRPVSQRIRHTLEFNLSN